MGKIGIQSYNKYVTRLQTALSQQPMNLLEIKNIYHDSKLHSECVLITMRCAEILAESALLSRHHDAGMIIVSETFELFESSQNHFGTPQQTHAILYGLISIKLRLLACYKNQECDEAIIEIVEAALARNPEMWNDTDTMQGIFLATHKAQALNRRMRHDEAANLYIKMQELGKEIKQPMLEAVSSLGWAYSVIMGGKSLAKQNLWQEAVTAWRSASTVIDAWKTSLTPDDDYDTDYIVAHYWNSAYAKWLAERGNNSEELAALIKTRNETERKALLSDILTHQLDFENKLITLFADK